MKKIIAVFLACYMSTVFYSAEPPLCISLGSMCAPAIHLRGPDFSQNFENSKKGFHIRKDAYPFDWIVSSFDALYTCINDDFNQFLHNLHKSRPYEIVDHYGFIFWHDWPTVVSGSFDVLNDDFGVTSHPLLSNWNDYTPLVREKYSRRIKRFKETCSGSEKIYFIRFHNTTRQQAIMLRDLIERKYKNLEFELIIISGDKTLWNLNKIKNFYMERDDWAKPDLWKNIFNQVGFEFRSYVINKSW